MIRDEFKAIGIPDWNIDDDAEQWLNSLGRELCVACAFGVSFNAATMVRISGVDKDQEISQVYPIASLRLVAAMAWAANDGFLVSINTRYVGVFAMFTYRGSRLCMTHAIEAYDMGLSGRTDVRGRQPLW